MPEPTNSSAAVTPGTPLLTVQPNDHLEEQAETVLETIPDAVLDATTDPVLEMTPDTVLASAIAETVMSTPGVTRLEPTLSTANLKTLLHRGPADGVRLVVRNRIADVDVNVATTRAHQARAVAHQIRREVAAALEAHQVTTGSITISVLAID